MFLHIVACFHFCWFWNIFFDTLQLVSGYFCAILVRNLVRVVVSCNVSLKIYQNSTEIEAWHLKIYNIQKTSGNLKKPPSDICEESCEDMWCELWRPFLSATSNASLPLMDRCTFQDNLDSRIFSIHYFHFKLQNFCKFKMYQISKLFAMDYRC